MNIICVICSDLLIPSDDVFYTPCGHIFHFACVTQWLERSKTCPHCRERTTLNKIHRIYFNFANSDAISEDTYSLQDKIDKLNFQLMLKEKDIKHYMEKIETLEKQKKGLKQEVGKTEKEIKEKTSTIYALKEQIKYFKEQNLEIEKIKKELEQLQKNVENYKNIKILLEASIEDVDEMISRTNDPSTLITYISVMKRQMTISLNKRRELRSNLRSLQQELTRVSMERNSLSQEYSKRMKLEEDIMVCETEKICLQNKLAKMEEEISSIKKSINSNSKTEDILINNSNNDIKQDKIENINNKTKSKEEDINSKEKNQSITKIEIDSPYLPVKSRGVFTLKQHTAFQKNSTIKLNSSILTKKPRIQETYTKNENIEINNIVYNGLGGHSKIEQFPHPSKSKTKKIIDTGSKAKKLKID
ncbi:E3 ubiquitin-protein ligase TRAIP, partial [Apis mellifera]|uniref:E3 ubiquitin-protein ligase TRAIP n=1 Tax=Apis mellifera TaxID=7460 RepID=A0A7M7SPS4_APIME